MYNSHTYSIYIYINLLFRYIAFDLIDYNQDGVHKEQTVRVSQLQASGQCNRKRGASTFKKGWPVKGHVRREKKSRWIQFHTNWNKYKVINCNHPLGAICSTTGFILCAFLLGMPPGCYYQIKTSGFMGTELGQNSYTQRREGGASCVCKEHTPCNSCVLCQGLLWNLSCINGCCIPNCRLV